MIWYKNRNVLSIIAFAFFIGASHAAAAAPSQLALVKEYVREISADERLLLDARKEADQAKTTNDKFLAAIHSSTLIQLEIKSQMRMLQQIHLGLNLDSAFTDLIPTLMKFYEMKIGLHQKIIDIASAFLAAPKPNVDYGALAAELPKIRAMSDDIDHTLFSEVSTLIIMTLIDPKPDSKNHVSHLLITKAERDELVRTLDINFGEKMEQKDQDYFVSTASVYKSALNEHKCSDEPWE